MRQTFSINLLHFNMNQVIIDNLMTIWMALTRFLLINFTVKFNVKFNYVYNRMLKM